MDHFRGAFSLASDVYSFGVLLWEIASQGKLPWAEFENAKELEYWRRLGRLVTLSQPPHCPESLYQLMRSCWEEPTRRPAMSEVLKSLETLGSLGAFKVSASQKALLPPLDGDSPYPYTETSKTSSSSDSGRGSDEIELESLPEAYHIPLATGVAGLREQQVRSRSTSGTSQNPLPKPGTPLVHQKPQASAEDDYAVNIRIT